MFNNFNCVIKTLKEGRKSNKLVLLKDLFSCSTLN